MNKNEISNVLFVISARISLTDTPDLEGRKEMLYLTTHSTHFIYGWNEKVYCFTYMGDIFYTFMQQYHIL